jgi:hypothetical protein
LYVITLAERALCREASRPLLKEILKPVHDAFAASGMSDDELAEFLEVEKHAMRACLMNTNEPPIRSVFDCNVLLQAMANATGPAGACLDYVREGAIVLFVSQPIPVR